MAQILIAHDPTFVRGAFADRMKQMLYEINPYVFLYGSHVRYQDAFKAYGDQAKDAPDVRRLLQTFGMVLRGEPDYWIRMLDRLVTRHLLPEQQLIITDVRFLNEIQYVRDLGGQLWRIERPDVEDGDPHFSEREWREATPDVVIANTGSLDALTALVMEALASHT